MKVQAALLDAHRRRLAVAFTPKGGCPLKDSDDDGYDDDDADIRSIHPQGWVPVESLCEGETDTLTLWHA